MGDKQCKYLIDASEGRVKRGKCKIDNGQCPFIRACRTRNIVVSSPLYGISGCPKEKKYEEEIKQEGEL